MRVARSKDRFGLPGLECDHAFLRWQQCSQSKIAHDSLRVRDTSTPTWCDRPVEGPACRPTLIPCRGVAPGVASNKAQKLKNQIKDATRLKAERGVASCGRRLVTVGRWVQSGPGSQYCQRVIAPCQARLRDKVPDRYQAAWSWIIKGGLVGNDDALVLDAYSQPSLPGSTLGLTAPSYAPQGGWPRPPS